MTNSTAKVHVASCDTALHNMLRGAASLDVTHTVVIALLFSNIEIARQFTLNFLLFNVHKKKCYSGSKKRSFCFLTQLSSSVLPVGVAPLL